MSRPVAALLLIAVLSVAACGGGSTGASPSAAAATAAAATAAAATPEGGRDYPADTPAAPVASPASTAASGETSEVAIAGFTFAPADLTVAAGTTVKWTNSDSAPHSVKSTDGGFASSGTLRNGDSYSTTFGTAGTFPYVCGIHSSMTGTVTVTP